MDLSRSLPPSNHPLSIEMAVTQCAAAAAGANRLHLWSLLLQSQLAWGWWLLAYPRLSRGKAWETLTESCQFLETCHQKAYHLSYFGDESLNSDVALGPGLGVASVCALAFAMLTRVCKASTHPGIRTATPKETHTHRTDRSCIQELRLEGPSLDPSLWRLHCAEVYEKEDPRRRLRRNRHACRRAQLGG